MHDQNKTTSQNKGGTHPPQEQSAARLEPQDAARLLAIALDDNRGEQADSDERIGELLQAHLRATWSPENGRDSVWTRLLRPWGRGRGADRQRTIGDLLLDPRTAVATLRAIRSHAKREAAAENGEPAHAVMTTIYFAATASALVFHRVKVTTYSYESLETSFEKLIDRAWMSASLVDLFRRAIEVCQREA